MNKLGLVVKTDDTKIVRSNEEQAAGKTLGEKIRTLINENLTEIGAKIVQGKPYVKKNGQTVIPYTVQGTLNMGALTFDDGSGPAQTHDWYLNFAASIPTEGGPTPVANVVAVAPVRAMTIAEARKLAAQGHK